MDLEVGNDSKGKKVHCVIKYITQRNRHNVMPPKNNSIIEDKAQWTHTFPGAAMVRTMPIGYRL